MVVETGMSRGTVSEAARRLRSRKLIKYRIGRPYTPERDARASAYEITEEGRDALRCSPLALLLNVPSVGEVTSDQPSKGSVIELSKYNNKENNYLEPNISQLGTTSNADGGYQPTKLRRRFELHDPMFSERACGLWGMALAAHYASEREVLSLDEIAAIWRVSREQTRQRLLAWKRKQLIGLIPLPGGNYQNNFTDGSELDFHVPSEAKMATDARRRTADEEKTEFNKAREEHFETWQEAKVPGRREKKNLLAEWRQVSGRQAQLDKAAEALLNETESAKAVGRPPPHQCRADKPGSTAGG